MQVVDYSQSSLATLHKNLRLFFFFAVQRIVLSPISGEPHPT